LSVALTTSILSVTNYPSASKSWTRKIGGKEVRVKTLKKSTRVHDLLGTQTHHVKKVLKKSLVQRPKSVTNNKEKRPVKCRHNCVQLSP